VDLSLPGNPGSRKIPFSFNKWIFHFRAIPEVERSCSPSTRDLSLPGKKKPRGWLRVQVF
jgi:hypothetical protein